MSDVQIKLHGVEELKEAVEEFTQAITRLGLFAKTMQQASDKIDEALTAHISALNTFCEHQTFLETQRREREDLAALGRTHGMQSRG